MTAMSRSRGSALAALLAVLALAVLPLVAAQLSLGYYQSFMTRLLVTMLLASSLNLLMGYGGLVALGHAGFAGVGAYTLVALMQAGVQSAWVLWGAALLMAGAVAFLIGLVVLRTRGVYFIMSTLAFAQMLYYVAVSLRAFGGDDGHNLTSRPVFGFGFDATHEHALYGVVLAVCVLVFGLMVRVTESRFGKALAGIRDNEARMRALGYPVYAIKLQAFVLTGAIAGLCGAMALTHEGFVTPLGMHWSQSAILIVMVVLGSLGHPLGGIVGALVWTVLQEVLRQYTEYWQWPLGALLIAIILFAPRGLCRLGLGTRPAALLPALRSRRIA